LNGVIASPHEIRSLRELLGNDFLIVTPGIRSSSGEAADQKRVMTPAEAVVPAPITLSSGGPSLQLTTRQGCGTHPRRNGVGDRHVSLSGDVPAGHLP